VLLAAILFFGILTMWVPGRWALALYQVALFALAIFFVVRRRARIGFHPIAALLAVAAAWGIFQIATHRSVYEWRTGDAVLIWVTNLAAFCSAFCLARRERFLRAVLIFAFLISVIAIFTVLTSPPDKVFWFFDVGTSSPTLGPFVYRNQYAAFVEAVLPLAIVRAILDRRRSATYIAIAATLFASVVAGGSRAGSFLCLAEIVVTPMLAYARRLISGRTLARVVVVTIAAVVLATGIAGWETIWKRLQEPNPYSVRAELVRSSLEMIRDRPLTGFGLGTWADAYPAYAHFDDGNFVNQAHNDWIQWAVEGGVPFFLIMLTIVALSIRPAIRSLWGIGLIGVFLHCMVDYPMQQRPALAAFFFAMLGMVAGYELPISKPVMKTSAPPKPT
jgi:O-antigen ligase